MQVEQDEECWGGQNAGQQNHGQIAACGSVKEEACPASRPEARAIHSPEKWFESTFGSHTSRGMNVTTSS